MELNTIGSSTLNTHLGMLVDLEPDLGTIAHLNHEGDSTYTWSRKNQVECDAAREHFEALRKKGFLAFKVNRTTGSKQRKPAVNFDPKAGKYIYTAPEMVTEFDPKANYVVTPQMQGG